MKPIVNVSAIILCFCMGMILSPAKAQSSDNSEKPAEESNFAVYLGCDIPLGAFAKTNYTNFALGSDKLLNGATTGGSFGMQYLYQFEGTSIEGRGHNIFLSADFIWNNMCKKYRIYYKDKGNKSPSYFNIPILIGYNYTHSFSPKVAIAVQAGLGVDLFFRTRDLVNDYYQYYKMAYTFAVGAGAEVIFAGHYSLGLRYNFLGNQGIQLKGSNSAAKGDDEQSDKPETNYLYKGSVSTFSIRLGYHF